MAKRLGELSYVIPQAAFLIPQPSNHQSVTIRNKNDFYYFFKLAHSPK